MLVPSIFGESLFDDWMDDFGFPGVRRPEFRVNTQNVMRTDIKETEQGYELNIDLPGYKKDDVKAQLKDGYLTVSASTNVNNDRKDEKGKYIRRERYCGSMSRSFFVGKNITEQDIHAKFEDGILKLTLPKEEPKQVEESKYIAIEG